MRIITILSLLSVCYGWTSFSSKKNTNVGISRRDAMEKAVVVVGSAAGIVATTMTTHTSPVLATVPLISKNKQTGISNDELADIIVRDIRDNQFMVRADLTRSIYDESATFTDEIDTYQLDKWIQGTKRLFVADKSKVELVPESLKVTDQEATFLFTEYLTFNIPFLLPKVYLSGKVILKRDPVSGLITSYQEKWDQDVNTVLLSAKFGG